VSVSVFVKNFCGEKLNPNLTPCAENAIAYNIGKFLLHSPPVYEQTLRELQRLTEAGSFNNYSYLQKLYVCGVLADFDRKVFFRANLFEPKARVELFSFN